MLRIMRNRGRLDDRAMLGYRLELRVAERSLRGAAARREATAGPRILGETTDCGTRQQRSQAKPNPLSERQGCNSALPG